MSQPVHRAGERRHRWVVMIPYEVTPGDARKMRPDHDDPEHDALPDGFLAGDEAPAPDDPRPWFGLHNVVREWIAGPVCYLCERTYSDELEALPCAGDSMLADGLSPESPLSPRIADAIGGVGRNDPCPCGSGRKYKKCHGQ